MCKVKMLFRAIPKLSSSVALERLGCPLSLHEIFAILVIVLRSGTSVWFYSALRNQRLNFCRRIMRGYICGAVKGGTGFVY